MSDESVEKEPKELLEPIEDSVARDNRLAGIIRRLYPKARAEEAKEMPDEATS